MSILARAIAVTKDATYIDARKPGPAPERLAEGLTAFLTTAFNRLGGSGVLLLDGHTAGALGLPTDVLPTGGEGKHHTAVAAMRADGFHAKEIHRWFHVKHGGAQISVGLLDHIDPDYCPMLAPRLTDTTAALATWHRLAGLPWFGSAAQAGNAILKSVGSMKHEGKIITPQWWTYPNKLPDGNPIEAPYYPSSWFRETSGSSTAYGYDRVRAGLAAMTTTPVAGFHLTHDDRKDFNPARSGWWRCEVADWLLFHLMPDPAGYNKALPDGTVWLTTPTLILLTELERQGVHGGFTVRESWTAPSHPGILKPYAVRLRDIYKVAEEIRDETERAIVQTSVKETYRQQNGEWRSENTDVKRPDWSAACNATARANLWRRCWAAGWETGGPNGPWPSWFDNDAVFYPGPDDPKAAIEPEGFELADKLGGFWPMPPRSVSRETGRPITREKVTA